MIEEYLAKEVDERLKKIEDSHQQELENQFNSIFLYIKKNQYKYINENGIVDISKLKIDLEPKRLELEKFYKDYSNKIEKVSEISARRDLASLDSSKEKLLKFSKIFAENTKIYNINYFKLLAEKQTQDIIDILSEKIRVLSDEAKLKNIEFGVKETEAILDKELETFKNTRVKTTIVTESDRIVNNVKLEIYEKSGLDPHVIFIGILDQRITKHICLPRHGLVFTIAFLKKYISQLKPALHPQCRSKIIATKKDLTPIAKVLDILKRFPILKKISKRKK